jgi:predicted Zn-dependent protease
MKTLLLLFLLTLLPAGSAFSELSSIDAHEFLVAKLAAESNDFGQALERFDRLIARNPGEPVLLFERAQTLLQSGKMDRGTSELRKVVAEHPGFADARRVLGRVLLDRARDDSAKLAEAARHLSESYLLDPADLNSGVTAAQIYVAIGRMEEAEKILANVVEQAPDQRMINYTYAQLLSKVGRGDEALPYLERVVALDPTYAPAVFQLVDIYQKSNEWKKAADVLGPLIERDPLNLDLQRQQSFFYLRAGESEKARERLEVLMKADPRDDRTAFYLAEALTDAGEYEEADAIYQKLLAQTPNDPDVLVSYGLSQLSQRKFDEAERTFRTVLAMNRVPENLTAMAKTQLALAELQRDNNSEATELAGSVLTYGGKMNLQAINIALEGLKRQGKNAEALQLLAPLVEEFGNDPYIRSRQTEFLLRSGKKAEARAIAEEQLASPNRQSLAVIDAYGAAEEYAEGIALLEKVRTRQPDDQNVIFQMGAFYERAGKTKDAERTFLQLLDKAPDHAPTLNYLGYMWAEAGTNLQRAEQMLVEAVRQEPANGAYIDSLGWVYYKLDKLDLAEKNLLEAAKLVPRDPTIQQHLGDVFRKRGDHGRALAAYRAALDMRPEAKEEAELKTKVAELERLAAPLR